MILPCFYNAPVSYYALLLRQEKCVFIEQFDNYTRQTYRNRCIILGGNGPISLSVPVVKHHQKKVQLKDVKIDNVNPWQQNHWKSISSSYKSSPYFEYIDYLFEKIYQKKFEYLIDLNMELFRTTCELLGINKEIHLSKEYHPVLKGDDFREIIHPKKNLILNDFSYTPHPYYQVFDNKFGFTSELSILDLLFNMGNESRMVLLKSIQ